MASVLAQRVGALSLKEEDAADKIQKDCSHEAQGTPCSTPVRKGITQLL